MTPLCPPVRPPSPVPIPDGRPKRGQIAGLGLPYCFPEADFLGSRRGERSPEAL